MAGKREGERERHLKSVVGDTPLWEGVCVCACTVCIHTRRGEGGCRRGGKRDREGERKRGGESETKERER